MGPLLPLILASSAPPTDTPNWHYKQLYDEMTELSGGLAGVPSSDGRAFFGITCEVVDPGQYVTFRYSFPEARRASSSGALVQIRVDKRPMFEDKWFTVKNVAVAGYPDQVSKLIAELNGAKEIMLRARDYEDQTVDSKFNVEGAETAIRWVLNECGWSKYPKRDKRR